MAPEKALFPLPLPKEGVFTVPSRAGSRERRRRSFDQAFHVAVMALNFWHADYQFPPVSLLARHPSSSQARVLENLRRLMKAFGSSDETFAVPSSGRRSTSLIAQLSDLCDFVTWEGLAGASYERGFHGAAGGFEAMARVPVKVDRAPELTPYSRLQPGRLKITGSGRWDPTEFLGDSLWMAFCEPESLRWSDSCVSQDVPDLTKERYEDVLELMKIWDAKGLLFIRDSMLEAEDSGLAMRFFTCHKSAEVDRMIGDRRARNFVEGRFPGVSKCLPPALLLADLEILPLHERFSVYVSDRKDFYHQFKVSHQRAATNALWPPIRAADLAKTRAFAAWSQRNLKRKAYDRIIHGDLFGSSDKTINNRRLAEVPALLQGCFASVPQGDHLGVEFAVDSHRGLLKSVGLLKDSDELRADRFFKGDRLVSGLVIDDFYTVSIEPVPLDARAEDIPGQTVAGTEMATALAAYEQQGILGSPEKDIADASKAKITGAELDTSLRVRSLGLATLASPANKRLALAFVSLHLSRLRWTTDQLHLCLIGGWVHSLLYRRPMMSILADSFGLVENAAVDSDAPVLLHLPRAVAQELVLLSSLIPFMVTDLAAKLSSTIYATDASDAKGAYVEAEVPAAMARALWRSGRKKGGYVRLLSRSRALLRKLDPAFEETAELEESDAGSVERPLGMRFHFLEICGGAGKIAASLSGKGWTVGPVIDLDRSPFYDLSMLRVLSWVYHLLEDGRLDSFMVEPPCTTFSPAQHPASRGYDCPRGYDPTDPKTLLGTTLALRSLSLIKKGSEMKCPGLLEQPRRTKMRRLSEWQYLLNALLAEEIWTAGCMFGSPHNKEFVFLICNMEAEFLHRKCDRSHQHVRIEGQFTKLSAVYTDELASCIGLAFDRALRQKLRLERIHDPKVSGLENPLCNEALLSSRWKVGAVWKWPRPLHINILETRVVQTLLKRLALESPCSRQVIVMDSNVGLSALVKGRSPSYGLRPCVRRIGATVVAGCLYPAYQFAPTRLNPADHPTRDNEIPEPLDSFWTSQPLKNLLDFAEVGSLSRAAANWIPLFSVLQKRPLPWLGSEECWRYERYAFKHYPFHLQVPTVFSSYAPLDFDQTLGFPGEGPPWIFGIMSFSDPPSALFHVLPGIALTWISSIASPQLLASFLCLWIFACFFILSVRQVSSRGRGAFGLFAAALWIAAAEGVSHGPPLIPRDSVDRVRAANRGALELPEGRPVLGKMQAYREKLLAAFDEWLNQDGMTLSALIGVGEPDIELINLQLERYGRSLYLAGRPYGHYSETINGVASRRPRIKRMLQPAWDLAYSWLRQEPPTHHLALPWQALLSLLVTALYWGWIREAGILALSWGGLTRIGEAISAVRRQLVLPRDVEFTASHALLQIDEPKTRFRTARHQVAKLDQPQLLALVDLAFHRLSPGQRLWPFSGQTMRKRFQRLLAANNLDRLPHGLSRGLDLGSLRAGGASWLMLVGDNVDMIRRRGRWVSIKVMEIYVQEVSAIQFVPNLPGNVKKQITDGAAIFPWILAQAQILDRISIPLSAWPIIFRGEAAKLEQNG